MTWRLPHHARRRLQPGLVRVVLAGRAILADLAGSPDATTLIRLLTLTIVLDGFTAVSVGVLQRNFRQDVLMKAIAIGFVFSAVISVTLAANGAGAYSFVVGLLAQSLVVGLLVLRIAAVPFRFAFDRSVARRLIVFGAPLAVGLGIESVLLYSDSVIVGHVLGTVDARVLPAGVQHLQLGAGDGRHGGAVCVDPGVLPTRRG